jgi:hypothetical protein
VTFSRFLGGQGVVNNALAARIQNSPYLSNVNQILADVEPPRVEQVAKELECKRQRKRPCESSKIRPRRYRSIHLRLIVENCFPNFTGK